jgi:hypothetical protein
MPQICDMGQTALLPFRRKECCGFFRLKNPTASARFEPAILGTRGQHAGMHLHFIHRPSDKPNLTFRKKMSVAVQKRHTEPTSFYIHWHSLTPQYSRDEPVSLLNIRKTFLSSRRSEIPNTYRNTSQHISPGFLANDANSGTNILRHGISTVTIRHVRLYRLHVNYYSPPLSRA